MIERVRANETGLDNKTYKKYQMLEAVSDPVIWCYVLLQITSTLVIGGLGVFSNLIISGFGFSYLQTQLLNMLLHIGLPEDVAASMALQLA